MSNEAPLPKPSAGEWLDDVLAGLSAYYLTSLPVLLGLWFGVSFLSRDGSTDPIAACVHFDAIHYIDIIRHGHTYNPNQRSTVAQFPAYPLIARWVCQATGLAPEEGALLTSNFFLAGAFVFLARWVRLRWPDATADQRMLVLAIFGLWPMGLFWRMPYAESLLLFGTLAVLYGMARGWPLLLLAVLTGFVTATRPVGVALTAAFLWHVLFGDRTIWLPPPLRGREPESVVARPPDPATTTNASPPVLSGRGAGVSEFFAHCWPRLAGGALLTPLACWGLLAYMLYQYLAFGTPWAFAKTQEHWSYGVPADQTWQAKACSLLSLEPIWGVYNPKSSRFWEKAPIPGDAIFNTMFWNPILFVIAAALVTVGAWKSWLSRSEGILAALLLLIPYLTRAYEMSMASHARFAAVVAVNYLVLGRLSAQTGSLLRIAFCGILGTFLALFTSLYVGIYLVF